MFGSIRQGHLLVRSLQRAALRAPFSSVAVSQPLRSLSKAPLLSTRTLHITASLKNASPAAPASAIPEEHAPEEQAPEDQVAEEQQPLEKFTDLADRGIIAPSVVNTITNDMNITTMTEIQTATIQESVQGRDL